jgi:hypothetical protein
MVFIYGINAFDLLARTLACNNQQQKQEHFDFGGWTMVVLTLWWLFTVVDYCGMFIGAGWWSYYS